MGPPNRQLSCESKVPYRLRVLCGLFATAAIASSNREPSESGVNILR
jgi:hypothetical protein